MIRQQGFTLIEVLILIIVLGMLANTVLIGLNTVGVKMPLVLANNINEQTAKQCIEYFLGQRRLLGYSAFSCPSSTVPGLCSSNLATGQSLTVSITCTTINTDTNYMTITATASGSGSIATLSTLVASY
jgi:prepilin-type N-terminal cleavage/methylation domain-containing protein